MLRAISTPILYLTSKIENSWLTLPKDNKKFWPWKVSLTEQHKLALDSAEARYCSSQHISLKKLNLVDRKIFALPEQQTNWQQIQNLQMQINFSPDMLDCTGKF